LGKRGRGHAAINVIRKSARDRWERGFLLGMVLLVQVTWCAALVYLALHFL